MPIITDLYLPSQTWVHALDARVKLLFVAALLVILLVFNNLFFMGVVLVLLHLLHGAAKMPRQRFAFIWRTLLPISLLILILRVIFYPVGTPVLQIWLIRITPMALAQGGVLGLRIISMAFAVFAWLYTTDPTLLVRSLVKLKLPYEWGLVLALALRYIPTFQGTYTLISEAQQARGLDLSGAGFRRVKLMMPIFVAMIISSLRASDQLAKALESRALGLPDIRRTSLVDLHFRPTDYLATALIFLTTLGLLYLNRRYGFGTHPFYLGVVL